MQHDSERQADSEYVKAAFLAHDPLLEVKKSYADRMEKEAIHDLVREKKGILILDLDHTLFQATMRPVSPEQKDLETWSFDTEVKHTGRLMEGKTYWFHLDSLPGAPFFIHLRPGLFSFLETASSMFELYAYTQGTFEYAKKILPGIDPSGSFFGTPFRLIARELDAVTGKAGRKNLSRVFPSEEALVLIIDDRDDVWDSNASSQNLIKLAPFFFFPDKERDRLFDSDLLFKPRLDDVVRPQMKDDQLVYLEHLLSDLHDELFFGQTPPESAQELSFPAVLNGKKQRLFEQIEFVKNDRVSQDIFRIVKQFGGSFVSLAQAGVAGKSVVYLGVPGQARRGSDPELIHPWFVLFCVSTYTLPSSPDVFSIARIEQENITNMWDCLTNEVADVDEDDLLNDLM